MTQHAAHALPGDYPLRLTASVRENLPYTLGGALFTGFGAWSVLDGQTVGWVLAGMGALCLVVFGGFLLPGSTYLELAEEGVTTSTLYWKRFVPWAQFERIYYLDVQDRYSTEGPVCFDYANETTGRPWERRVNRWLADCDDAYLDLYGVGGRQLAWILNRHLHTYRKAQ